MSLPTDHPFFGPRPVVGDRVYIDFGDSIQTGGELTGTVEAITDDTLTVDGVIIGINECVFIEVRKPCHRGHTEPCLCEN